MVSDNNNPFRNYVEGADWWLARSKHPAKHIEKLFVKQDVACLLYHVVGCIFDVGKLSSGEYLIHIQLAYTEWDVDLCLSDIHIFLEEVVQEEPDVGAD